MKLKNTNNERSVRGKMLRRLGFKETENAPAKSSKEEFHSTKEQFEKFFCRVLTTKEEEDLLKWINSHRRPGANASPSDLEAVRARLVEESQRKPPQDLFQLDALITREPVAGITHSSSGTTDEDGDCINRERKYDLRNTGVDTVRIQVPVGVSREEATRVLRKAAEWIESRQEVLDPKVWEGLGGRGTIILDRRVDARTE